MPITFLPLSDLNRFFAGNPVEAFHVSEIEFLTNAVKVGCAFFRFSLLGVIHTCRKSAAIDGFVVANSII